MTTSGCSDPCADFGIGVGGGGREKKETAAWRVFGHFANMILQGGICNYIPAKKGSGSTVPQALAETEHVGWLWACQQKGQDQEDRGIQTR